MLDKLGNVGGVANGGEYLPYGLRAGIKSVKLKALCLPFKPIGAYVVIRSHKRKRGNGSTSRSSSVNSCGQV